MTLSPSTRPTPPLSPLSPTPFRSRPRQFSWRALATLLVSLLVSVSLAAPVALTPSGTSFSFTVRGDGPIRYYLDPSTRTLILPEAVVAQGAAFPEGVKVEAREGGLVLTLDGPFTVTLTPDGRALAVARVTAPPAEPTRLGATDAAPTLYPLSNASPSQVAGLLTRLYNNLRVEVDERQRALLVIVSPTDKALIDNLIKALDAPRPQVAFEAEILEVNQDLTQSLGIQWDSIFTFKLTEGEVPGIASLGPVSRSPLSLNFGLNLLKTNGAAKVLARPRVTTLDGLEARLNATQTTPLIVPGTSGAGSVQNITTGITLRLLPKVAPDGTIEAQLTISVSTPTGVTSQGVPQFSTREATTTVRVANGEPIAIGGLLETRQFEGVSKVPLLGDIPIIGALFTTTRTQVTNTDLVIVVTPRIVASLAADPGRPITNDVPNQP